MRASSRGCHLQQVEQPERLELQPDPDAQPAGQVVPPVHAVEPHVRSQAHDEEQSTAPVHAPGPPQLIEHLPIPQVTLVQSSGPLQLTLQSLDGPQSMGAWQSRMPLQLIVHGPVPHWIPPAQSSMPLH